MAGAISSLGIGSGILTSDVIDQLKSVDEDSIIKPIENKLSLNTQKQESFDLLSSLMSTFKSSTSALSYDTLFDNKNVVVTGDSLVTVETGANVESFTLETVTLAKKDITALGSFADAISTPIATGAGILTIGGIDVAYDATMTLEDLAQAITDAAGSTVSASIIQTGTGAYTLMVSSVNTGADQALAISNAGLLDPSLLDPLNGYNNVQVASDAEFKFNGVTATRSTNNFDDLILGVDITLKTEGDISNIDISQDTDSITGELQLFVDSYNSLMTNLDDMTMSDIDTGVKGIFNGDSFIKSISYEIKRVVTSLTDDRDSLVNFGIDIDKYGVMSLDKSVLEEKLADDSAAVELFFAGGTDADGNDVTGIFRTLDDKVNSYTGYGEILSTFETGLKTDAEHLTDRYSKARASLDTRYEIMTQRFIAYDAMISRINAQFSSLQMMISAEVNGDG